MKVFLFSVVVLLLITFVNLAFAQESESGVKIAVVDMIRVFETHPQMAPTLKRLTAEREASSGRYRELSSKLKATLQKHQEQIRANQKESAVETLKEANELEKAIATIGTKEYRDLEEKFRVQKLDLLKNIRESIRKYNETAKFALILDLSAASPNGLPQIVDSPGAEDITKEIISYIAKNQ